MPLSPVAGFALALLCTIALRLSVFVSFSRILSIMSMKAPISALRLGKFGEACAVVSFLSMGMAFADIERQAASLIYMASGFLHALMVAGSVMTAAKERAATDN